MTVKEAAVIEVYTGICLLTGDKRKYAYEYASSLIGRPIFTHEFLTLKEELKKRSYKDLVEICQNLEECSMERLTKEIVTKQGKVVVYTKGKYKDTTAAEMECCDIRNVLRKLSGYENTGLTPPQIMELAERDTAKAPIDIEDDYGFFVCPSCGNSIYASDDFESHKFCLNCGQRIRWEE